MFDDINTVASAPGTGDDWRYRMGREAARLAFGEDLELADDDVVRIETTFDDGYDPTYTAGDPSFAVTVTVRDAEGRLLRSAEYGTSQVDDFLRSLLAG